MSSPPPTNAPPAQAREVRAILTFHDQTRDAVAHVIDHAKRDRVRRAVLGWAACWGAAIAALFLPLLHFVLVPALLIAGPMLGMARLGEKRTITRIAGPCPACGGAVSFRPGGSAANVVRCDHCRRPLAWAIPAEV